MQEILAQKCERLCEFQRDDEYGFRQYTVKDQPTGKKFENLRRILQAIDFLAGDALREEITGRLERASGVCEDPVEYILTVNDRRDRLILQKKS
ncbi:hypothetical protein COU77_01925 [Candidatus Peregrinibacteria bacterium CG10_big_fil_rev_8_21_14_0_10_49_16]|nr:MAG: hypothetical protein COW95_04120 [Candidatus Peregrinibacteria bacterium CG22_combo_CG10-13_8_21_14_all_49_11]PIR52145.1 MAG: hypothetical protein COU77_01925 [Candidatus Peregrinibacteria bacterium CG10_big_fil_rev_8_21_14_0_10_49_16]